MRQLTALLILILLAASILARGQVTPELSSVVGVFTSAPESSKTVGTQLTFTGLNRPEVTMIWPDGIGKTMKKIFENRNLIILQSVGAIGSTETAYLEIINKRFLIVSVGAFEIVLPNKSVTLSQYQGAIK